MTGTNMAIFLTGDMHGENGVRKFGARWFDAKKPVPLTRSDYMIILGDFGLVWRAPPSDSETYWLDWLERKPWTTLVVLGNHENHRLIRELPPEPWQGGLVRRFREHVLQLVDNEVVEIDGKTFFVRGGAHSLDRDLREEGKDWWPEETPDAAERQEAIDKLNALNWRVDYVLTHEAPFGQYEHVFPELDKRFLAQDEYAAWLQTIADRLDFERWFFGHLHEDRFDLGRYTALYGNVATLDGRPCERVRG